MIPCSRFLDLVRRLQLFSLTSDLSRSDTLSSFTFCFVSISLFIASRWLLGRQLLVVLFPAVSRLRVDRPCGSPFLNWLCGGFLSLLYSGRKRRCIASGRHKDRTGFGNLVSRLLLFSFASSFPQRCSDLHALHHTTPHHTTPYQHHARNLEISSFTFQHHIREHLYFFFSLSSLPRLESSRTSSGKASLLQSQGP